MSDSIFAEFRRRLWLPPRAHGDVVVGRTVSFLELFYDLVYVVVIARAAHALAGDITWRSVGEFLVIFGLIWMAWVNGTLYHELHGREDVRTRVFVFIQMLLLAMLAVFVDEAAGGSGRQFAIVYVLHQAVLWWLWFSVRLQDTEEFMDVTRRYLTGMMVSIGLMVISGFVPADVRVALWVFLVLLWFGSGVRLSSSEALEAGIRATESMVERFGLFVIIVLGEVVVGVVDGLSEVEHNSRSIATGMIGLCVGFAYWWTYFDYVGRRLPKDSGPTRTRWMFLHFPVTSSIAAAGAAMVSLVDHAGDERTPAATAWLLAGSVALGLSAMILKMRTLGDYDRLPGIYKPLTRVMAPAAAVALITAVWAPTPWLFALSLVVILLGIWLFAVNRWLRLDNHETIRPQDET
ncbi:MAG: low temperature requirement protein A [bacterium]|nr:low temperature requirement protein A [bacterium]